ncbi:MAG TPA: DUF3365 domain-containing protein [Nitrospira sp.]|nr:DUF3365 domain-containing protein [Nitrospira sp.]
MRNPRFNRVTPIQSGEEARRIDRSKLLALFWGFLIFATPVTVTTAEDESTVRETARLLAILLDSGRVTIGNNQELINDPAQGDKHFTPEVFAAQTIIQFKQRTGHDLNKLASAQLPAMAKPLLEQLLKDSMTTVGTYQTVINVQGLKYKGLIPATFATETGARFQLWSGLYLKQTAPDYLVRNPKNKADPFESAAMNTMSESTFVRDGEQVVSAVADEGKSLRVLLPLFYVASCMSCHGDPKGERDITGYAREGARVGSLGGAISVKLPLPLRE